MRQPPRPRVGLPVLISVTTAVLALLVFAFLTFGESEYPEFPDRLGVPASPQELSLITFSEIETQVRRATNGFLATDRTSWSSQPGAVRMFGETTDEIFKLYSAEALQVPGSSDLAADLPTDWDTQPHQFVDLNAPSIGAGGGLVFPIADPRAFSGGADSAEGFSYSAAINGVVPPDAVGGSHDGQRLPMPVRWRYVLRDGKVGTLDDDKRWVGNGTASVGNPIVGRIAYWTDDLSCRINVNTAAEGAYWDTPRADSLEERAYAENQPARDEFQRQPGHPAMVCLSSVLFPKRRYYLPGTEGAMDPLSLADAERLWRLAPGIGTGGSRGGARRISEAEPLVAAEPAEHHLYESLEDVLESNPALSPAVAQRVGQGEFLLTTESNAPEMTLLGFPRIAMWPVASSEDERSPFDQKIADLATLQDIAYFFQREQGTDLHRELYVVSKSNNVRLFEFLQEPTRFKIPGYADTRLRRKYRTGSYSDWAQINLAILGYVRSANLSDPTAPVAYTPDADTSGHGQVQPMCAGGGSVHPERWWLEFSPYPIAGARSFSASEVALVVVISGYVDASGTAYGDSDGLDPGERRFEVGLVIETFCPGQGFTQIRPLARLRGTSSTSGGAIDADPIPLRIDAEDYDLSQFDSIAKSSPSIGGSGGLGVFTTNTIGQPLAWTRANNPGKSFKVDGSAMSLDAIGKDGLGFGLVVYSNNYGPGSPYSIWQVLSIRPEIGLLPVQIPAPQLPAELTSIGTWEERLQAAVEDPQALIRSGDVVRSFVIRHGDARLLHSRLVPVVEKPIGSGEHFAAHPDFSDSAERMSHSLVDHHGRPMHGHKVGRALVEGVAYAPSVRPDFPVAPGSSDYLMLENQTLELDPSVTGDFDTGLARTPDGAYTNHPDPGVYFADGTPYFDRLDDASTNNAAVFSPQRIMPGPGMLGSLPSGGATGIPWRTLLFRPDPRHFGSTETPDHVLLDSFWMPVPEPHGISHDHSTDGKINMNYAIAPFAHIRRATALHALFKAEKLMAIPTSAAPVYKTQTSTESWRHHIDTEQTLLQFEQRFAGGEYFRSASEICEQYLVPEGQLLGERVDGDYPAMRAFWSEHKLTGDNVKERPYTNLHTRLTTKSNAFKIYAIVQPISKAADGDPAVFDPASDTLHDAVPISATLRRLLDGTPDCGSLDQVNRGFPNYLNGDVRTLPGLDSLYRYSIVGAEPDLREPVEVSEVRHAEAGEVSLRWHARNADVFVVERSTDLRRWEVIDPNFGGTAPWTEFTDLAPPPGADAYYRVRRR